MYVLFEIVFDYYCFEAGVKKFTSPTPGASNFHIWAIWNNQLYARRANKNISDIDKLVNIHVSTYIHICYMLFNQQQCFIYSTASFLSKLRAKKVEKLRHRTASANNGLLEISKWNIGFRNRERLFPVLPIVKKIKL
jgi:hypothetical protein